MKIFCLFVFCCDQRFGKIENRVGSSLLHGHRHAGAAPFIH